MKLLRTRFFESGMVRYFLGGVIGLLLGVLFANARVVEFDAKLSINTIVQAIVTNCVSLVVAFLIQRWLHSEKLEKEFLMDKLKKLAEFAEQLRDLDQQAKLTELTDIFKKMNMTAIGIRDVVQRFDRRSFSKDIFDCTAAIQELKKLMTNTPISDIKAHAERAKCSTKVKDGIIKWADEHWDEVVAKKSALCARILIAQTYAMRA